MQSIRCYGETKFFQQCPRYVTAEKGPCFCWEHTVQQKVRIQELSVSHQQEWAPLGVYISNRPEIEPERYKEAYPEVQFVKGGSRMQELAEDDQNVHTPEVQVGMNAVIRKLEEWALQRGIRTERDLAGTILRTVHDPNIVQRQALEHLMHCYRWNDNTVMFGVTYPKLSSWVWARIQLPHPDRALLHERFFEEVAASAGQCLNGNMVRLMNTFASIDADLSFQSAPSLQHEMSAISKLVETGKLSIPEAFLRAEPILIAAGINGKEADPWLEALCDAGKDISEAAMYQYTYGRFD